MMLYHSLPIFVTAPTENHHETHEESSILNQLPGDGVQGDSSACCNMPLPIRLSCETAASQNTHDLLTPPPQRVVVQENPSLILGSEESRVIQDHLNRATPSLWVMQRTATHSQSCRLGERGASDVSLSSNLEAVLLPRTAQTSLQLSSEAAETQGRGSGAPSWSAANGELQTLDDSQRLQTSAAVSRAIGLGAALAPWSRSSFSTRVEPRRIRRVYRAVIERVGVPDIMVLPLVTPSIVTRPESIPLRRSARIAEKRARVSGGVSLVRTETSVVPLAAASQPRRSTGISASRNGATGASHIEAAPRVIDLAESSRPRRSARVASGISEPATFQDTVSSAPTSRHFARAVSTRARGTSATQPPQGTLSNSDSYVAGGSEEVSRDSSERFSRLPDDLFGSVLSESSESDYTHQFSEDDGTFQFSDEDNALQLSDSGDESVDQPRDPPHDRLRRGNLERETKEEGPDSEHELREEGLEGVHEFGMIAEDDKLRLLNVELDLDAWNIRVRPENLLLFAFTEVSVPKWHQSLPKVRKEEIMLGTSPAYMYISRSKKTVLAHALCNLYPRRNFVITRNKESRYLLAKPARISMIEFKAAVEIAGVRTIRCNQFGMKADPFAYFWLDNICTSQRGTMILDLGVYWKTPGFLLGFRQKAGLENDRATMIPTLNDLFMRRGLYLPGADQCDRATISMVIKFGVADTCGLPFTIDRIIVYPKLVHYYKRTSTFSIVQLPDKYKGTRSKVIHWLKFLDFVKEEEDLNSLSGCRIEVRGKVTSLADGIKMANFAQSYVAAKFDVYKVPLSEYTSNARSMIQRMLDGHLTRGPNTRNVPPLVKRAMATLHNSMGFWNHTLEQYLKRDVYNAASDKYNWEKHWDLVQVNAPVIVIPWYPITQGRREYQIPESDLNPDVNDIEPDTELVIEIKNKVLFKRNGRQWSVVKTMGLAQAYSSSLTKTEVAREIARQYGRLYQEYFKVKTERRTRRLLRDQD